MGRAPTIYFGEYWWVFGIVWAIGILFWIWYRWPIVMADGEDLLPLSDAELRELRSLWLLADWDNWRLTATQLRRIDYLERRYHVGRQ